MSRATVRAALTAYLQPPAVAGLNVVLRAQPKDLTGVQWSSGQPGDSDGCIGVVTFEQQVETPVAMDGAGGGRLTTYQVGLQLFHRSVEPDGLVAMDQFDTLVDAVCNYLRSDPTLGLAIEDATFQRLISGAHEGLEVQFGEPSLGNDAGGWVETWAVIRFPVIEYNQAT